MELTLFLNYRHTSLSPFRWEYDKKNDFRLYWIMVSQPPLQLHFVLWSDSKTIAKGKGNFFLISMDQLICFIHTKLEMDNFCYYKAVEWTWWLKVIGTYESAHDRPCFGYAHSKEIIYAICHAKIASTPLVCFQRITFIFQRLLPR